MADTKLPRRSRRLAEMKASSNKGAKVRPRPTRFPQLMKLPNELLIQVMQACYDNRGHGKGRNGCVWLHLASTCRLLRSMVLPIGFQRLQLKDSPTDAGQQDTLHANLLALEKAPQVRDTARLLIIRTVREKVVYHPQDPEILVRCIKAMPKLQELSLRLPFAGGDNLAPLLGSHFQFLPPAMTLDNITRLSVHSRRAEDLSAVVKHCPNLENLFAEIKCCIHHNALINAAAKAPKLKYLMLTRNVPRPRPDGAAGPMGWCRRDMMHLSQILPNIRHLALAGQMEDEELTDLVPHFAKFKQLEQLDITDEQVVPWDAVDGRMRQDEDDRLERRIENGLDSDEDGDFVDNMSEDEVARQEVMSHSANEERGVVAMTFFKECPMLKRLCFVRLDSGEVFEPQRESDEVVGVMCVAKTPPTVCCHAPYTNDGLWEFGFPRRFMARTLYSSGRWFLHHDQEYV